MTTYTVIFDSLCNLCSNLVQLLEQLDRGDRFQYLPMQDLEGLARYGLTAADCELGMILIEEAQPDHRWQGSAAAEEIGRLLPGGATFVAAYQGLPGLKWAGDRLYDQVRDNRYAWFGRRSQPYTTAYPICETGCAGIQA